MVKTTLAAFFERDLLKVKEELGLYHSEADIWAIRPGISNSAGNLALHLVGNLQHFIGASLGNTGYIRQRELEFTQKDIPRAQLYIMLDETILVVKNSLNTIQDEDLAMNFPMEKHGTVVSVYYMLQHLSTHLSYHLGQINYHRRLI